MPNNAKLLDGWFREGSWPALTCPECLDDQLGMTDWGTFESKESEFVRGHPDWEPDWINGHFKGVLTCKAASCFGEVIVAGEFRTTILGQDDIPNQVLLKYANPPLLLTDALPPGTPERVVAAMEAASRVIWMDPNSAANRLRYATEELLTALKIKRFYNSRGKRRSCTAHQRIILLSEGKYKQEADLLMAVKWIGNAGSHDDELQAKDVIEGAEILKVVLERVYDGGPDRIARRAKEIVKAKGRPRAKRAEMK